MRVSECYPGLKVGYLILLEKTHLIVAGHNRTAYKCKCDCGKIVTRTALSLHPNAHCGASFHNRKYYHPDGMSKDGFRKVYTTWYKIKSRCEDPNDKDYHNYGARGITLCDEWHELNNFVKWYWEESNHGILSPKYQTVDRIDVNKGYSPTNCRLLTMVQQSNNKRTNKIVEIDGEKLTYSEAARKYNIKKDTVRWRYLHGKRGWDLVDHHDSSKVYVFIDGEEMTLKEISEAYNIPITTLYHWRKYKKDRCEFETKVHNYKEEQSIEHEQELQLS